MFEDWLCHLILPLLAYAALAAAAFLVHGDAKAALFAAAGAALLLLFVGIHNSWDAVSFHVYVTRGSKGGKS